MKIRWQMLQLAEILMKSIMGSGDLAIADPQINSAPEITRRSRLFQLQFENGSFVFGFFLKN